jgi:hypothetical protein
MIRINLLLAAVTALALAIASPVSAQPLFSPPAIGPQFFDRGSENRSAVRPLHELLPIVRRQLEGDYVGMVSLEEGGSSPYYVIRWRFPDGRIGDVRVDAQSGSVLDR